MGKNVAVFVDVANIFYAAKAAGVDIDYVTLLKASSAGRDLVRAYAYTGLDPDNDNQRNFHDFLRRSGYKVVSKDIRKYGDGKVKANLDIELVVDMMKTARNLDVAIVVSGDGDFAPAIRAVQEMGVRVEVVSFRGNTSSDLMDVADQFTDIIQIAKVEKGSSRSGRRVAGDEQDLSMTEVPDKQSEGTGDRSRGRGRTRRTTSTPVAATATSRSRARVAVADSGEAPVVVALPGEKLSRAAASSDVSTGLPTDLDLDEDVQDLEVDDLIPADAGGEDQSTEDGPRRRRRRGGRGRGRARGREDGAFADAPAGAAREADGPDGPSPDEGEELDDAPRPARRPASAFGSVWDSQIGIPAAKRPAPIVDEDDFEEPAVPEYLITERRQRDSARSGGGMRGGRGRGGAYAAALDRERFGGGRGSTPSRFPQPAPGGREPNFNRPPDRDRPDRPDRMERGGRGDQQAFRPAPRPAPRGSGDEPWSEVPPEIEAMLRAQLGSRPAAEPRREAPSAPSDESAVPAAADEAAGAATRSPRGRRPSRSAAVDAAAAGTSPEGEAESAPPEVAPATRRAPARRSRASAAETGATEAGPAEATEAPEAPARPKRATTKATGTATRRTSTSRAQSSTTEGASSDAPAEGAVNGDAGADGGMAPTAPKRRVTRRKAEPAA